MITTTRNRLQGFSLIELMIVVAIVAIISAIAYPMYTDYVRKAQRVDATAALLRLQSQQEKYYLDNNSYADDIADLTISGTERGYYTLSVTSGDASGFTAQAVPPTGSPQVNDDECQLFTINAQGVKGAKDGDGADNAAECWK